MYIVDMHEIKFDSNCFTYQHPHDKSSPKFIIGNNFYSSRSSDKVLVASSDRKVHYDHEKKSAKRERERERERERDNEVKSRLHGLWKNSNQVHSLLESKIKSDTVIYTEK